MTLTAAAHNRLHSEGLIDERGVTRRPRPATCGTCRLAVTAAIADTGFTTSCWPTPTTTLGELQALTAGLRTYTALPDALLHRDHHRIRSNDADHRHVLVEHRCGDTPPPPNPIHQPRATAAATLDGPPPF